MFQGSQAKKVEIEYTFNRAICFEKPVELHQPSATVPHKTFGFVLPLALFGRIGWGVYSLDSARKHNSDQVPLIQVADYQKV